MLLLALSSSSGIACCSGDSRDGELLDLDGLGRLAQDEEMVGLESDGQGVEVGQVHDLVAVGGTEDVQEELGAAGILQKSERKDKEVPYGKN